jgi:hypothetical protein
LPLSLYAGGFKVNMAKSKLTVIERPRPAIRVGDLVEIGDPRTGAPDYFLCYMRVEAVEEVGDDTVYTCSMHLPDRGDVTIRCPRGGIVGCFREIDLNDF